MGHFYVEVIAFARMVHNYLLAKQKKVPPLDAYETILFCK